MKFFLTISIAILLSGCGGDVVGSLVDDFGATKIYCKNPRPKYCTMIFQPVCGKPTNKTYSNGCVACTDKNVFYYTKGKCK